MESRSGSVGGRPSSTTAPIADPERALPAPGPLEGRIETADILIVSQDAISEDLIEQVRAIKGALVPPLQDKEEAN